MENLWIKRRFQKFEKQNGGLKSRGCSLFWNFLKGRWLCCHRPRSPAARFLLVFRQHSGRSGLVPKVGVGFFSTTPFFVYFIIFCERVSYAKVSGPKGDGLQWLTYVGSFRFFGDVPKRGFQPSRGMFEWFRAALRRWGDRCKHSRG